MVVSEVALERQLELLYRVGRKRPAFTMRPASKSAPTAPKAIFVRPVAEDSEIRPALRSYRRKTATPATPRLAPLKPGARVPEPAAPLTIMEDALCFTPTPLSAQPVLKVRTPPPPTRVVSRHPLTPVVVPITNAGAHLAVEQIRLAGDQQELSDNLFMFMRSCFGVGAMFAVAGALAQGLYGFAYGRVHAEVEDLHLSLSLPSCLRIARSRRGIFRGPPPPDGGAVQRPLWRALHSSQPRDVLVSPVIVDGQVTLLLYAQGEAGGRINDLAASNIEQVCAALGNSLLRLAV